jgi:hypothetical protein
MENKRDKQKQSLFIVWYYSLGKDKGRIEKVNLISLSSLFLSPNKH